CHTALVWYPMGNLEGRYGHQNPANESDFAKGATAFSLPWGYQSGAMINNLIVFQQYCRTYGKTHEGLAPLAINARRNGLRTPWRYYSLHEPYAIDLNDYLNSRPVMA